MDEEGLGFLKRGLVDLFALGMGGAPESQSFLCYLRQACQASKGSIVGQTRLPHQVKSIPPSVIL